MLHADLCAILRRLCHLFPVVNNAPSITHHISCLHASVTFLCLLLLALGPFVCVPTYRACSVLFISLKEFLTCNRHLSQASRHHNSLTSWQDAVALPCGLRLPTVVLQSFSECAWRNVRCTELGLGRISAAAAAAK